jgi:hypothetical protein
MYSLRLLKQAILGTVVCPTKNAILDLEGYRLVAAGNKKYAPPCPCECTGGLPRPLIQTPTIQ